MKPNKRKDANHKEIVRHLKSIGCSVADTSNVGNGFPDIVVGYRGVNYLFEIKDGNKPPSQRKLRESQHDFFSKWGGSVYVISKLEDVLKIIGISGEE